MDVHSIQKNSSREGPRVSAKPNHKQITEHAPSNQEPPVMLAPDPDENQTSEPKFRITKDMLTKVIEEIRQKPKITINAKKSTEQERILTQIADKIEQIEIINEQNNKQNTEAEDNFLSKVVQIILSLTDKAKQSQLSDEEQNTLKKIDNVLAMWIKAKENTTNSKIIDSFKGNVITLAGQLPLYIKTATAAYFGASYQYVNDYRRTQFTMRKRAIPGTTPEFWTEKDWTELFGKIPTSDIEKIQLLERLIDNIEKSKNAQSFDKVNIFPSKVDKFYEAKLESVLDHITKCKERLIKEKKSERKRDRIKELEKKIAQIETIIKALCRYRGNSGLQNFKNDQLLDIKLRIAFSKAPQIPGPITVFRGTGAVLVENELITQSISNPDSLKNKIIHEAGYMSTTLNSKQVQTSAQNTGIFLEIHVPKGKTALMATKELEVRDNSSQLRYEEEVVFPPGQEILIIDAKRMENQKIYITGILL